MSDLDQVALDASLFDEPVTGIALYAKELHRALLDIETPVDLWGAQQTGSIRRTGPSRTAWTLAELPFQLNKHRPKIFHAVSNFNLPLIKIPGVRYVLTVHDVVPLLMPDTVSMRFRIQFQGWLANSVKIADAIICVSHEAKRTLIERFDVDENKISVIYHGAEHALLAPEVDETTHAYFEVQNFSKPFVLYSGALDARKNVGLLVEAIEHLFEAGNKTTLVLSGQRWFGASSIENRVRNAQAKGVDIRFTGYLETPVFYALMKRAGVFVFPSLYEGFGLPPLEAMTLGVPTVVSDGGSLPEICSPGALVVNRFDSKQLAHVLNSLLNDEKKRKALGAKGTKHAQTFSWQKCARETTAVYERVLK
jgi:glycosyltransferase involved in cell wall biosynthesis